jgi:hypothetical protein
MRASLINNPVPGEQVAGVSPRLEPRVVGWNRRLNLFPGRALSDLALTSEQAGRAGRLTTRGQVLSSGIVIGMEAGLDHQTSPADTFFVQVSAGLGLCASGEEVFVPRAARVAVRDLPVLAPVTQLAGQPAGSTLGTLIDASAPLPHAGILVFQPATVEMAGGFDPEDQCAQDPQNDPYDDWQLVEAARLMLYAWPDATLPLPAFEAQWRNRLAWAIFDDELQRAPDQIAPWEEAGLPVALIGFDAAWTPLFVDRASVARLGGRSRRRSTAIPGIGNPFLEQARIEQLSEHLNSPALKGVPISQVAAEFRFLPPVGLLPAAAITFVTAGTTRAAATPFFPGSYFVDAAPAPVEQLDAVVKASASLEPFDLQLTGRVRVLVPVPQIWFEPNLLKIEQVDPEFQQTIDRFVNVRGIWLNRRADLRDKASRLNQSLEGVPLTFPTPDPDALETNEFVAADPIDSTDPRFRLPEDSYGTEVVAGNAQVTLLETLRTQLTAMNGVSGDVKDLDTLGLRRFVSDVLEAKVKRSDDRIDLGFLRVQTDIYRHRQVMLGTTAATRLATSSSLASIAQSDTAATTKDDLSAYLTSSKVVPPQGQILTTEQVTRSTRLPLGASDVSLPTTFQTRADTISTGGLKVGGGSISLGGGSISLGGLTTGARINVGTPRLSALGALPAAAVPEVAGPDAVLNLESSAFTRAAPQTAAAALFDSTQITQQSPAVGAVEDFRTVTIAERLQTPPSVEAKAFSVSSKADVISSFTGADTVNIGDLSAPGVPTDNGQGNRTFAQIDGAVVGRILAGNFDVVPDNADEGAFFAAGVRAMDSVVQILRLIEGRVQTYRRAIALCNTAIAAIGALQTKALARLQVLGGGLAEARHDVSVARALLDEEAGRVGGINARRDKIITDQVKFVLYFRTRTADNAHDFPYRAIDPALVESPVPACLAEELNAPPEMRAIVNVLREAPLAWFRYLPPIFQRLDRLDLVLGVLQLAKRRASFADLQLAPPAALSAPGPLAPAIMRTFTAQQAVVAQSRLAATQVDLNAFAGLSWQDAHQNAKQIVSLGDLIDAGHLRADASRQAAQELENIYRVAACLYVHFSSVLPVIRLNWAERASQYDGPLDFRDLTALPRWVEIDVLDRKEMQVIVEWLFQRIDPNQPQAIALMNDIVRVALLLASHAPVNQIIAGSVPKATPVRIGGLVQLSVNVNQVRVGMHALVYSNNQTVVRAVVEDMGGGVASARVIQAAAGIVNVEQGAVAHFAQPETFDMRPGILLR